MEKRSKLINLIKAIIILAVMAFITVGLLKLLVLKSEDGVNQFYAFYKQPENSIDVLFLGSSKVYCDIATGVLWENHGIASFDLGGAEAPAWVSYYQLKEALKTQRPKVICYEVSVAAMYRTSYQSDNWATDNSYGMKWNSNRIDQLRINSEEEDFYNRINPFNVIHGRYTDLKKKDFVNEKDTARFKGFDSRDEIIEIEAPDMSQVTETEPCSEKAETYIRKIIELTKEEGIPLIMFASPYDVNESQQMIINYIGTIADSENVEFIDFNRKYDDMGLDFYTDMSVGHHLSFTGNYKFSDHFGKLLKERYDIPDRRGDSRYVSWDWDAALQDYERNDLRIKNSESLEEVMSLAQNGYILFAVNGENGFIIKDGQIAVEGGSRFRIPFESDGETFLFVEEGEGDYKHYCKLFINDEEYEEDFENVLFVYDAVRHEYVRTLFY